MSRDPMFHPRHSPYSGRNVYFVDVLFNDGWDEPAAVHELVASRYRAKKLIKRIDRNIAFNGIHSAKITRATQGCVWETGWKIHERGFRCRVEHM
jgi:hypothetical protein